MQFLFALTLAAAVTTAAGAVADRSRYCIFACPPETTLGEAWTSSLTSTYLQCTYEAHNSESPSCAYSQNDGTLIADNSSTSCTQQAVHLCGCEYVCPEVAGMTSRLVSSQLYANEPWRLECTYDNGESCPYSKLSGGRQLEDSSFCPRTVGNTCRPQTATLAIVDGAQAAMRRRLRTQARHGATSVPDKLA